MPNGTAGGSAMARALSRAAERERLHEAVARLDHVGWALDALLGEQRRLQPFARGVAGVQPLDVAAAVDEREQAGRARGRKAERMAELVGIEPAQLAGRHGGAERADRAGRMEAALAQVGRAGARERDRGLVTRHDGFDQRLAAGVLRVGDAERRRNDGAAAMRRAVAVAVVKLDAVRRGAAEERRIEQIGAPRAAGHRHVSGRTHGRHHGLGARRHVAGRARDHHADGVEQMPPRVVAHLLGERVMAQRADEFDDRLRCAGGGMQRVDSFGVRHGSSGFSVSA